MKRRILFFCLVLSLIAAGCSGETPESVVKSYFEAVIAGDESRLRSLSCADWEAQAINQAASFRSMNATLQDLTCRADGQDGNFTRVTCEGAIVTDYNGETREWPLETFRVTQEGGSWRFCGEG
jgi:hypothetical protein